MGKFIYKKCTDIIIFLTVGEIEKSLKILNWHKITRLEFLMIFFLIFYS